MSLHKQLQKMVHFVTHLSAEPPSLSEVLKLAS